jgi:hypothetical protein
MKKTFPILFLFCSLPVLLPAQIGIYQHGTVTRMHMGNCMFAPPQRFMAAFGPPAGTVNEEGCPEYTLVSKDVVFVIVGKSSNQLIPLAESIDFRMRKNELAVRIDDAKKESKFAIKEMMVRSDWERLQRHIDDKMRASEVREAARQTD